MIKFLVLIVFAFVLFVILDFIWFKLAGNFFKAEVGSILRLSGAGEWQVRTWAALLAYLFMALGTVLFVLPQSATLGQVILYGGAFGLVTFGIFDLTNLAILTAWTTRFILVDMSWGIVTNAVVASSLFTLARVLWR